MLNGRHTWNDPESVIVYVPLSEESTVVLLLSTVGHRSDVEALFEMQIVPRSELRHIDANQTA